MSAFAVIYDRLGSPLEPGLLERVMGRLSHRGPDGQDSFVSGPLAMGHWHFWTTPEEIGERQPLKVDGLPFSLVFDGRLDNRDDLIAALSIPTREGCLLSDAALVLRAYAAWGESCVERLIGEFALALFDEYSQTLFCARDRLGDRTLFYALYGNLLVVASEPWSILGASFNDPEVDEITAVNFFVGHAAPGGRTFFKDVAELLPAHTMKFKAPDKLHFLYYWSPDFSIRLRYKSDAEYAEHFLALMKNSVRCRLRSVGPVAVQMSGGLDSTSLACLAAEMLAPQQLTTFSYVFKEIYECDEQVYIDAVYQKWNTISIKLFADDAWPFQELENISMNPSYPDMLPFRLLQNRIYERVKQEDFRIILSGEFGDHMFAGGNDWLADLFVERKFRQVFQQFLPWLPLGIRKILRYGFLQRAARLILNSMPGGKNLRRSQVFPSWLTPLSIKMLSCQEKVFYPRHDLLLNLMSPQISFVKGYDASCYGIEVRHPFHDQRLVDFILAVPAYYLQRGPVTKYIMREAMKGVLPESIRTRTNKTTILSLYLRGKKREEKILKHYLNLPHQHWHRFVDTDKIKKLIKDNNTNYLPVIWWSISYQLWYQRFIKSGGFHEQI